MKIGLFKRFKLNLRLVNHCDHDLNLITPKKYPIRVTSIRDSKLLQDNFLRVKFHGLYVINIIRNNIRDTIILNRLKK